MGTNYFFSTKAWTRHHIGKKSHKWVFIFHGYEEDDFGVQLKSYDEWKAYLSNKEVKLYDESMEKVKLASFLKMVEQSLTDQENQKSSLLNGGWYDQYGYPFLNHYFS